VISIPGPDQPLPGLGDLVRPLADPIIAAWTSSIERTLPNEFTQLSDQLDSRLGVPLSEAVRRALGARGASWEIGEGLGYRPALREAIDEFVEVVIGHRQLQVAFDDLDGAAFDGTQPLQTLGAGARRQALLAALALYAAESNVGVGPIIATVEEPEVGLHAAAQRNTAEDLARLPRFGVQVVLTTHSPSVLSRLPRDWYRLVRSVSTIHAGTETGIQRRTEIVPSADLDAITEELGLSPADALLGSTYVVVEGRSDELILTAWAATLGLDLPTAGVRFAPARGHGWAEHSLRLQEIVHPSARIEFLLDEGPETRATARSLRRSSGDRVQVKFLPTTEIEGLFSRRAVGAWLGEAATATVPDPPTKAWLRRTSRASLHRDYAVVQDGVDIASRMLEAEIHPDIVDFLSGLAGQTQ